MNVIPYKVCAPYENFWKAAKVYFYQPKSINKQVLLSEFVLAVQLENSPDKRDFHEISNKLYDMYVKQYSLLHNQCQLYFPLKFKDVHSDYAFEQMNGTFLLLRRLIPKLNQYNEEFYEFFILEKNEFKIHIFTKYTNEKKVVLNSFSTEPKKHDPFVVLKFTQIEISWSDNLIQLSYDITLGEKGINWLKSVFIKKFTKIMVNVNEENNRNNVTNQLFYSNVVDVIQYYKLYEEMKLKYAKFFIENWIDSTDPKKFVYEDIGIATYLILLWNEGKVPVKKFKKQRFIDLGCGNGLLVHILNSEGHLGIGLDMRKRKMWDIYGSNTILKEETIIPTTNTFYTEVDWLIGNHSDELTAWIPIMARRSTNCQYFVLPCCPYQLNGQKFQRKNSSLSSYQDFMMYVKNISELCGFETYVDKLRIPSTKRICLIGRNKQELSDTEFIFSNKSLINFISEECVANRNDQYKNLGNNDLLGEIKISANRSLEFKVRESVEKVRNCTKLSPELINQILLNVMKVLLNEKQLCSVLRNNVICNWNRGIKISIHKLAETINEKLLKQLKQECKGIQTLLKNHYYIFEVSQGCVQFRSPENLLEISKKYLNEGNKVKWKKRNCWFYDFHPDKCPLSDDICSYSHNK